MQDFRYVAPVSCENNKFIKILFRDGVFVFSKSSPLPTHRNLKSVFISASFSIISTIKSGFFCLAIQPTVTIFSLFTDFRAEESEVYRKCCRSGYSLSYSAIIAAAMDTAAQLAVRSYARKQSLIRISCLHGKT